VILGRDPSADIVVSDPRVSRRHARMTWRDGRCVLEDIGSKNGTFINGDRRGSAELHDHDWVSFGGVVARVDLLADGHAEVLRSARAIDLPRVLDADALRQSDPDASGLLLSLLRSAMQLTKADRGFILVLGPDGSIHPQVASGFSPAPASDEPFAGSTGAIERALATGTSIVTCDAQVDGFFANRQSVIDQRLATVACVPLRTDSMPVGLLYVDGGSTLDGFTELDVEILEAIADQAAMVLTTLRLRGDVREIARVLPNATPALPRDFRQQLGELATDAGVTV
jgi:GAF domain-containing protein